MVYIVCSGGFAAWPVTDLDFFFSKYMYIKK